MSLQLQIITPEQVIFDAEVDSVVVPGKKGRFQILTNHAPIVSTLETGKIEIISRTNQPISLDKSLLELSPADDKVLVLNVTGGILEFNNNKCIILAD
ncbi:hypothetical protein GO491_10385 [Flavobacteriaceae bacterium Ap0902]|nr:hypothetical protein [Flavobacteriaceae bacterium Ap0902]